MAQKWIVNDGTFKMSASVEYHKDLAKDHSTTKGGGRWQLDHDKKMLYLWGVSSDFGAADPEVLKSAILEGRLALRYEGYKVMFSSRVDDHKPSDEWFEELCTVN